MRSPKVFIFMAALALGSAVSALPVGVTGAQTPGTQVLFPAGGDVSGSKVVLDASASAGTTKVQFELTGFSLSDSVIATAVQTAYGWIAQWNSTTVADGGPYTLQSIATEGGSTTTSPGVSIYVVNTPILAVPSTASGTQVGLDVLPAVGVTGVAFSLSGAGCPSDNYGNDPICVLTATPTNYGWLALWNTTQWANGTYYPYVSVSYDTGDHETLSTPVVTVANTGPTVVIPANRAPSNTVYGQQVLDCIAPTSTSEVWLWVSGGGLSEPVLLGDATPSIYGWLLVWDTDAEGDGNYSIYCSEEYPYGGIGAGPPISATIDEFYAIH